MEFLNRRKTTQTFLAPVRKAYTGVHHAKRLLLTVEILFLLLIPTFALYVFAVQFIFQKKESVLLLSKELYAKEGLEAGLRGMVESVSKSEVQQSAVFSSFVDRDGVVGFIEVIENIGAEARVWLEFEVVNVRDDDLVLELKVLGSFNELFHFINLLEHAPMHISFKTFFVGKEIPRGLTHRKSSDTWYGEFMITAPIISSLR